MNNVLWTRSAKEKRDNTVQGNDVMRQYFNATEQELREMGLTPRSCEIEVAFTDYKLLFEVDKDRLIRITTVEITDVKKRWL